jgi:hypothetical protein
MKALCLPEWVGRAVSLDIFAANMKYNIIMDISYLIVTLSFGFTV